MAHTSADSDNHSYLKGQHLASLAAVLPLDVAGNGNDAKEHGLFHSSGVKTQAQLVELEVRDDGGTYNNIHTSDGHVSASKDEEEENEKFQRLQTQMIVASAINNTIADIQARIDGYNQEFARLEAEGKQYSKEWWSTYDDWEAAQWEEAVAVSEAEKANEATDKGVAEVQRISPDETDEEVAERLNNKADEAAAERAEANTALEQAQTEEEVAQAQDAVTKADNKRTASLAELRRQAEHSSMDAYVDYTKEKHEAIVAGLEADLAELDAKIAKNDADKAKVLAEREQLIELQKKLEDPDIQEKLKSGEMTIDDLDAPEFYRDELEQRLNGEQPTEYASTPVEMEATQSEIKVEHAKVDPGSTGSAAGSHVEDKNATTAAFNESADPNQPANAPDGPAVVVDNRPVVAAQAQTLG